MTDELKPCPFCGKSANEWESGTLANCERHDGDIFPMPVSWWNTRPIEDALKAEVASLQADIMQAIVAAHNGREENERLRDALIKLRDWAKAYPVEVFPEPDMKGVREALTLHGFTIDQVSASNFRWLLSRVTETVEKALTA